MKRAFLSFLALFACITLAMAQSRISGIDQEPIIGASVLLKGTSVGSITDIDGRFQISNVPENAKTIVVSFVGMKTQEIPISDQEMKILLQNDSKQIDEVIVVAYGTQKKSSFTGLRNEPCRMLPPPWKVTLQDCKLPQLPANRVNPPLSESEVAAQ